MALKMLTVEDLIAKLQEMPPTAKVVGFNNDTLEHEEVHPVSQVWERDGVVWLRQITWDFSYRNY